MPRRFDSRGWNRQFKWQPIRRDRWDPFPKDHLPFVDDFGVLNQQSVKSLPPRRNFMPYTPEKQGTTPQDWRYRGSELLSPYVDTPWNNRIGKPDMPSWNYRVYGPLFP